MCIKLAEIYERCNNNVNWVKGKYTCVCVGECRYIMSVYDCVGVYICVIVYVCMCSHVNDEKTDGNIFTTPNRIHINKVTMSWSPVLLLLPHSISLGLVSLFWRANLK